HRAVVQIRRAQPDAVEERRDVPGWIRFHQTLALDAEGLHRLVRTDRRVLVPALDALDVGLDLFDRDDRSGALAPVAARAVRIEDHLADGGFRLIDGVGELRRL